jgi:penicillin-binding protein 1A
MQLARVLFLTPEKNFRRKIQETLLAIQIERRYTK